MLSVLVARVSLHCANPFLSFDHLAAYLGEVPEDSAVVRKVSREEKVTKLRPTGVYGNVRMYLRRLETLIPQRCAGSDFSSVTVSICLAGSHLGYLSDRTVDRL